MVDQHLIRPCVGRMNVIVLSTEESYPLLNSYVGGVGRGDGRGVCSGGSPLCR